MTVMSVTSREIHLAARPSGEPVPSDFALVEVELPDPEDGQILVRNRLVSVDPYMRGRMNDVPSYVPPFSLGEPLDGGAVGEVVASRAEGFAEGDLVLHDRGWREYALLDARRVRRIDADAAPPSAYLGVLGGTGLTAYVGLLDIAGLREGDVVFVSGAAGAVGSIAGQIAKLRGHTVIGSAGSAAKVAHLRDDLGFDAAFDYHDGPVSKRLREAAPDGIDVYFDNVGGEHLEAAIFSLRNHGRVALCGAVSAYNATEAPAGPRNLALAIGKRLTLRGFIVFDHNDRRADFEREVGGWLREGRLAAHETIVEGGIEQAPQAFIDLLRGANTGKMLVRLG
jgi:NADPH-dependent curcumin reductase CurA